MDDLRLNAIPTLDPKRSTYSAIPRPGHDVHAATLLVVHPERATCCLGVHFLVGADLDASRSEVVPVPFE
jgi:hypothetical protein